MSTPQAGILAPIPAHGLHLFFDLAPNAELGGLLPTLEALAEGDETVLGLGLPLVAALGRRIADLRAFPQLAAPVAIPATQNACWLWLRGDDRGTLLHRSRHIVASVGADLQLRRCLDVFCHDGGRDLTGYEDGTENPVGDEALAAALVAGQGAGLDGGSFAAIQEWLHDLDRFEMMPRARQDHTIGRRRDDNEEIEDAPASAHVKRTAQESFAPKAFVLRRSMPFIDGPRAGLAFLAFGASLDAFEAQLKRMSGLEDGIVDALFTFSQPLSGSYFWCPPLNAAGRPDLSALT
jgi:porphyrinogen peroxidase